MTATAGIVEVELEELFDKISNNGREWAQLVNRIRVVFERPTYIFPVRDAVYLWHTYRQKVISREECLELMTRIIHMQDNQLVFDEEAVDSRVSAMWKHKQHLNRRKMFDLTKKFLNLAFVPVFMSDASLPFTDEMKLQRPTNKKRRRLSDVPKEKKLKPETETAKNSDAPILDVAEPPNVDREQQQANCQ